MSVKKYDIEIPKLDSQIISMSILDKDKQPTQLGEDDLLFMTVRLSPDSEKFVFQKKLGKGITYNSETQKYDIEINSNDTKDMLYNTDYGYDITIYYDSNKPKQKVVGVFKISNKYTLNEVS